MVNDLKDMTSNRGSEGGGMGVMLRCKGKDEETFLPRCDQMPLALTLTPSLLRPVVQSLY